MSILITTCPNGHDIDVSSTVWCSKAEIPPGWKHQTVCHVCGQGFTVTVENCSILPSNISGTIH